MLCSPIGYYTHFNFFFFARVPRFAFSMTLVPVFDRFIRFLMKKTGRGKTFSTGLCVFLVNVLGTLTLMASCILLASFCSGKLVARCVRDPGGAYAVCD